jgi:hypothetical protein
VTKISVGGRHILEVVACDVQRPQYVDLKLTIVATGSFRVDRLFLVNAKFRNIW